MTLGQQAAIDLRNMIADSPTTFTFDGLEYVGAVSGKNLRRNLEIGGFQDEPEITLVVALKTAEGANTFTTAPRVKDDVLIGSTRYRIIRTELDEFSEALQMDLGSLNQ